MRPLGLAVPVPYPRWSIVRIITLVPLLIAFGPPALAGDILKVRRDQKVLGDFVNSNKLSL
jgi:hypothetical protein